MKHEKGREGIVQVVPSYLEYIWPHVVPHLNKGRKYWEDLYDLEDIFNSAYSGTTQLWVYIKEERVDCVLITSVRFYPKSNWLNYEYLGGTNLRDALKHIYVIEKWAKEQGLTGVEVGGRLGLPQLLKSVKQFDVKPSKMTFFFRRKFEEFEHA